MSRAVLISTAALAVVSCPAAALGQNVGDVIYNYDGEEIFYAGVRREATLTGEQLLLSLDFVTSRTDGRPGLGLMRQSRAGRAEEIVPVQGHGGVPRGQRTRRDYIIARNADFPTVAVARRTNDVGFSAVAWTYEDLASRTPPLPQLIAELIGVVRDPQVGNPRYRLKLRLSNTRGPEGMPFRVSRVDANGSGYAMTKLTGPAAIRVNNDAIFEYELLEDASLPKVLIQSPLNETVAEFDVADLLTRVEEPFTPGDVAALAGRYRTMAGTLLTLHPVEGGLSGNGQTVGARPEIAESVQLRLVDGRLVGDMYGYADGRRTLNGPIRFQIDSRYPLRGQFTDTRARKDYAACPVAEDDPGDWDDPRLRIGYGFWARLDEVRASLAPTGRTRVLEVKLSLWSTSGGGAVALWAGAGSQGVQMMGPVNGFGGEPTGARSLQRCQHTTMVFRTSGALQGVDTVMLEGTHNGARFALPWDVGRELSRVVVNPAPPLPAPSPAPTPAPQLSPIPADPSGSPLANIGPSRPTTGGPAAAGSVPAGTETYSNYGIWDFRIEELKPGVDGHWQAVLWVRDAASYPVGMAPGQVTLVLIDEDGRTLRSDPLLYRASATGPADGLQVIPETLWMEKGDEIRLRMVFDNSAGFMPVRFRIAGGGHDPLSRTFDFR